MRQGMCPYQWLGVLAAGALLLGELVSSAAQELTSDETRFFETKIRPVLVQECYSCHSSKTDNVRGGLLVDSKEGLLRGGESGAAVVPKDLSASLLWTAINYEDFQMPPREQLSPQVIADFKTWIEMGAPDPREAVVLRDPSTVTAEDIKQGRQFWAFQPPRAPAIPEDSSGWSLTTIDRLIAAKLAEHRLSPSPDAEAATVLRRLTFDLVGLPPTPEQIDAFTRAWQIEPQQAVESLADQLLADPGFGERWGRHWLDLARYAESNGKENNQTYPEAWRYRDYVIDSLNADKPYDQFVQEQVAGDLLPVRNDADWANHLVATGFLALGPKSLNERNARQFQLDLIDEQIDVTTRVFLGVSVACARCHDHKFDPIPQADYYAMAGIFQNASTHYGTLDSFQNRRTSNLLILPIDDPNPELEKLGVAELEELREDVAAAREQLEEARRARREAARSGSNSNRSIVDIAAATTRLGLAEARLNAYDERGNPLSFCMGVQPRENLSNARLLVRGEFDKPAEEVPRGFPQVLTANPPKIKANSSGRLELARWLGDEKNPLTARVMVNRVWQHLLGQGIVRTPENFGATGQSPTHPELLDHLAVEFMNKRWSVKQLVRSIVTSRIYRTESAFVAEKFVVDPDNLYLWRVDPKRLEAEAIRDALLQASGEMDRTRPRASPIAAAGPATVREGVLISAMAPGATMMMQPRNRRPGLGRDARVTQLDAPRTCRSVYLPIVRDQFPRALDVFDFADASFVISQRDTSNTPDQGLYMLNNSFVIDQSNALARRVADQVSTPREQVALAFRLTLGRPPSEAELQATEDFLNSSEFLASSRVRTPADLQRLSVLCQSIIASAEFRFLQ